MIGSPRSRCTFFSRRGEELGVARYTNSRGSMKDMV